MVKLERERIVRAALEVLNRDGLDGLTLRKLASELHVQAPALYWHFRNKQSLLDEMATTVFQEHWQDFVAAPDTDWQSWMLGYGTNLRTMLLDFRDGARVFSGTRLTDDALYEPLERSLRILTGAGFTLHHAVIAGSTVYAFVVGFTIEEQAVFPVRGTRDPGYDLAKREARVDPDRFPLAREVGPDVLGNYDTRFNEGLAVIVRGLEALRVT